MAWKKRRRKADRCDEVPDYVRMSRDTLPRRGPFFRAQSRKKRVLLNPRIFAVREDTRVCDQRSAVSAQPLNLRNFRLAEGHPRCPTGEFVTNRKLIAES